MANNDVSTGTSSLRRRTLTAHNEATMRTVVDCGGAGRLVLDEPAPHGGAGDGPRRFRPCSERCAAARR